jgi:hypothetical protein
MLPGEAGASGVLCWLDSVSAGLLLMVVPGQFRPFSQLAAHWKSARPPSAGEGDEAYLRAS